MVRIPDHRSAADRKLKQYFPTDQQFLYQNLMVFPNPDKPELNIDD